MTLGPVVLPANRQIPANQLTVWQQNGGTSSICDILLLFAYGAPVMIGMSSGLPAAWVVRCKKCSCTITCRAIDPQLERSEPTKSDPPPREDVVVSCSCCWSAFRYNPTEVFKGQPSPSNTCPERRKMEGVDNDRASHNKRRARQMPRS